MFLYKVCIDVFFIDGWVVYMMFECLLDELMLGGLVFDMVGGNFMVF